MDSSLLDPFIEAKIYSLLHDPFHKPWDIGGHTSYSKRKMQDICEILSMRSYDEYSKVLSEADILASTIDRQILNIYYVFDKRGLLDRMDVKAAEYVFKNIFEPRKSIDISLESKRAVSISNQVYDFLFDEIRKIKHILTQSKYGNILAKLISYHILYFYSEPLWILYGGKNNPADTRIPHHTVFDHNSAVASTVNWVIDKNISGYLVLVDVGGVHDFIKKSRKSRDTWASSFLASYVIWFALKPLVLMLGPDIFITPPNRMNPIYHSTLLGWLESIFDELKIDKHKLRIFSNELLRKFFKGLYDFDIQKDYPKYAIQPAVIKLVLPSLDKLIEITSEWLRMANEDPIAKRLLGDDRFLEILREWVDKQDSHNIDDKNYIRKLLEQLVEYSWSQIVEIILNTESNRLNTNSTFYSKYWNEIRQYIYELGYHETVPFIVRIGIEKVDAAKTKISDMANRLVNEGININAEKMEKILYPLMLYFLEEEINTDINVHYPLKRTPYYKLKLTDRLSKLYPDYRVDPRYDIGYGDKSTKGYLYCTSCGEQPAILLIGNVFPDALKPIYIEGEKLCPICFLKRLFNYDEVYRNVARNIFGGDRDISLVFLSTSDIATFPYRKYLIDNYETIRSLNFKKDKTLDIYLSEIPFTPSESSFIIPPRYIYEVLARRSTEKRSFSKGLDRLLRLPAEHDFMFFSSNKDISSGWSGLSIELHKKTKDPRSKFLSPWLYYGLIYLDGDNMGRIFKGELFKGKKHPKKNSDEIHFYIDYLKTSINLTFVQKEASETIRYILDAIKNTLPKWKKELEIGEFVQKISDIVNLISSSSVGIPEDIKVGQTLYFLLIFYKPLIEKGKVKFIFRPSILTSLSYLVTLSRSLITSILNDVATVTRNYGFVIYAGGDDILAYIPIAIFNVSEDRLELNITSLDAIHDLRRLYSIGNSRFESFAKIEMPHKNQIVESNFYVPMLYGFGRSTVLSIAHYRTPLNMVLTITEDALKKFAKEGSCWKYEDSYLQRRDGFTLVLIGRSGFEYATLPNIIYRNKDEIQIFTVEIIRDIIFNVVNGVISRSFLIDLENDPFLQKYSNNILGRELANRLLERIISRNIQEKTDESTDKILRIFRNVDHIEKCVGNTPAKCVNTYIMIGKMCKILYSAWRGMA